MKKNVNLLWRISLPLWICLFALTAVLPPFSAVASVNQFSVRAIIPENQVNKKNTYFDLRVNPGDSQTLELEITNTADKEITAYVKLNAATTERNGLISYNRPEMVDEGLLYPVSDFVQVLQPETRIPGGESRVVQVQMDVPDVKIPGALLGGFVISAEYTEDEDEQQAEGIQLQNRFVYVIGLKITQDDEVVPPDFHLKSITPGLINHRTAVVVNLQNSEAAIVKGMDLHGRVYKSGSSEVFRELKLTGKEFAPNSNGNFVIDWDSAPLEPGTYRLHLLAEHNERQWEWDEEFTIGADEAGNANDNAVELIKPSPWRYIWPILALLLILLLIFLAYYMGRKSKKKEEEKD